METDNNTLDAFVERLLQEKQFENLEPEVHEQLKKDLLGRAEDYVNAALVSELSETDQKAFEELLDANKPTEELQAFLSSHIKEMDQVVAGALLKFRNIYVSA